MVHAGRCVFLSIDTLEPRRSLALPAGTLDLCVDPSDQSRAFAYGRVQGHTPNAVLVNLETGHTGASLQLGIFDAAFSPDGRWIAGVAKYNRDIENGLLVLDAETLAIVRLVPAEYPEQVAFSPDRTLLAFATWKKGQVWRMDDLLGAAADAAS